MRKPYFSFMRKRSKQEKAIRKTIFLCVRVSSYTGNYVFREYFGKIFPDINDPSVAGGRHYGPPLRFKFCFLSFVVFSFFSFSKKKTKTQQTGNANIKQTNLNLPTNPPSLIYDSFDNEEKYDKIDIHPHGYLPFIIAKNRAAAGARTV